MKRNQTTGERHEVGPNPVRFAHAVEKAAKNEKDEDVHAKLVVVYDQDFENQRVDLVLKSRGPGHSPVFRNVPVADTGTPRLDVRSFTTIRDLEESGDEAWKADFGVLLFFDEDVRSHFDERGRMATDSSTRHQGHGRLFMPIGPRVLAESLFDYVTIPNGAGDLDRIQEGDDAIVYEDGSFINKKETGELIIKVATSGFIGKTDQLVADGNPIARQGDNVGGDGATNITEGSSTWTAGD